MLFFSDNPQRWLPGTFVSFLQFAGTEVDGQRVEVVALLVGGDDEPVIRYVVIASDGSSSVASPDELDMYAAYEEGEPDEATPAG